MAVVEVDAAQLESLNKANQLFNSLLEDPKTGLSLKKAIKEKQRHYEDACGIAHALDLVGERWALLVMRELLFGPKRFSDLR